METLFNSELDISNALKELKSSPIFALYLAAEEIAHSNFWSWLIEKYPSFATVFFEDIDVSDIHSITRFSYGFDFIIWMKQTNDEMNKHDYRCYIIENNLRTMPSENELVRNNDNLAKLGWTCLGKKVVSYTKFSEYFNPRGWEKQTYYELAEKLRDKAFSLPEMTPFDLESVLQYVKLVQTAAKIHSYYNNKHANVLDYEQENKTLKYLAIDDIFVRIKMADLAFYIKENLKLSEKYSRFQIHVDSAIQHNEPVLNIYLECETKKFGIQLQTYRYSRFCQFKKLYNAARCFEYFSEKGWLEKDYVSSNNKQYLSYKVDNLYYLTYQPKKDFSIQGMSYQDIVSKIKEEIEFGLSVLCEKRD